MSTSIRNIFFEHDVCAMIPSTLEDQHRCFDRKAGEGFYREYRFTKYDANRLMGMKPDLSAIQPWAGFIMFRKTKETVEFVEEWLKYCEDYLIISFDESVLGKELPGFRANRNDQTVLGVLLRKNHWKCKSLPHHWLYNVRNDKTL